MSHARNRTVALAAAALAAASALSTSAHAANGTWIGGTAVDPATTLPWQDPANWAGGIVPGSTAATAGSSFDVAVFNTAGGTNTGAAVDSGRNVGGITFDIASGAGRSIAGPQTLYLSNGALIQVTPASNTDSNMGISSPLTLVGPSATLAAYSANANAGIKPSGNITTSAPSGTSTLFLDGANLSGVLTSNSQISGNITDGASAKLAITKNGVGIWDIRGAANTYSGATTINAGAIRINSAGGMSPNSDYVINGNSSLRVSVSGASGRSVTVNTATGYQSGSSPFSGSNSAIVINLANDTGPAVTFNMGSSTVTADVTLGSAVNLTGTTAGQGGFTLASGPAGFRVTYNRDVNLGSVDRTFDVADTPGVSTDLRFTSVVTGSGGVIKTGPGTLKFEGTANYTGTTTVEAGRVLLIPATWDPVVTGANGATIKGGRIELDYTSTGVSPLSNATAAIVAGRIKSGPADTTHTIAAVDNGVDTVSLTRAYYGDLNLDGKVNADDYALIDRGRAAGLTGWTNGDLNYSGAVDAADYLLIDKTFATSGVPHAALDALVAERLAEFGDAYVATLLASVPEPSSLLAACGFAAPFLTRRRK